MSRGPTAVVNPADTFSRAHYEPGSICSLQPQTDPVEVDVFLEMMDLQQRADEPFYIESVLSGQ